MGAKSVNCANAFIGILKNGILMVHSVGFVANARICSRGAIILPLKSCVSGTGAVYNFREFPSVAH